MSYFIKKLSELKQKILGHLKEDSEGTQHYSFRDTFQYRLLSIVVGLFFIHSLLVALDSSLLTKPILTIPSSGELTLISLFPLMILGYVFIYICTGIGSWAVDKILLLGEDIKKRVSLSVFLSDAIAIVALIAFILYRVIFSIPLGGAR